MALVKGKFVDKDIHIQSNNDPVDPKDLARKSYVDQKAADEAAAAVAVLDLSGKADLVDGKVPSSQLPSFVDDVEEYADLASFPEEGSAGKLYVAQDTNKVYRWSGSVYIEISASPGSTDAVPEGSLNKYFTDERAQAALASALSGKSDVGHTHVAADVTDFASAASAAAPVQSVAGKTGAVSLVKGDVGLGNVDNTSDLDKPISTATATALAGKQASLGTGTTSQYLRGDLTWQTLSVDNTDLINRIAALESYTQQTVFVDAVAGVDEVGRGSMLRPFKTINYAYSQVPSLGNQSNTLYNANVERFITEKLVIHLAPGRYVENVVLGFKRARVKLTGDGATIVGDVKMSVKLADFPASNLENLKASFPAPFTGGSAFMNFELAGKSGGGLESDPTANVLVITGQAALAFEESNVPGSGVIFPNWDGSFGQFYSYLDCVSLGNFVVTTSHNAAQPTLPAGVIEIESCNIASSATAYRMHTGLVPYAYLADFANWNTGSKGTTNKCPSGTWTLKAHNSTFGNVIGPRLTIGEMDGCRIYDIDRTMRGTVDNGAISGSTSTSYLGMINNQFRIYGGSGDLASAYKIGQASGATRYKIDSVSYTTLAFSRNSSGVLSARTLDVGAGVNYDFLDDARSIFVNDPATNYSRSANTVDAALEGIDAALGGKQNSLGTGTTSQYLRGDLTWQTITGGLTGKKETFTLSAGDIANAYVNCAHLAAADTMMVMSGGVVHIEGESYTLSVVGGVTRITFIGDLVDPSPSKLEAGDKVHIQYLK